MSSHRLCKTDFFVTVLNIEKFEFGICFVFRAADFGFNITQKTPETVKFFHFSPVYPVDQLRFSLQKHLKVNNSCHCFYLLYSFKPLPPFKIKAQEIKSFGRYHRQKESGEMDTLCGTLIPQFAIPELLTRQSGISESFKPFYPG